MDPFVFKGCVEIRELLGKKADDELKLLELIEEVPVDSIYYHTHSYFLRHPYIAGLYPNDFANWAATEVRDKVLGEKLASVTPKPPKSIEEVRLELIEIIDEHLTSIHSIPFVGYGEPFYFMKSRIIEIPTEISAHTFQEFKESLRKINTSVVYNHVFEAGTRSRRGRSDFAIWLEHALNKRTLADKFEMIDSYMYSLEGLRNKLLELCDKEIEG